MKKNRKGFMLVEVVITSTVVLTALVFFYTQFDKLYIKYNERNNYHDVDGLYATKEVINYMITNTNHNLEFNSYVTHVFNNGHYGYIIKNKAVDLTIGCVRDEDLGDDDQGYAECMSVQNDVKRDINKNSIATVMNMYNIRNMVITEYDKCYLDKSLCVNKDSNSESSNESKLDKSPGLKEAVDNETFKDYIDYVIGYYNIEESNIDSADNVYNFIVLTEVEGIDGNVHYSNVRLR